MNMLEKKTFALTSTFETLDAGQLDQFMLTTPGFFMTLQYKKATHQRKTLFRSG